MDGNEMYIVVASLAICILFSYAFQQLTKKSVLIVVIAVGTFGLALAFSGNDLVNFIGVPMAAFHSYEAMQNAFLTSGTLPAEFSMSILEKRYQQSLYFYLSLEQ